MPFTRSAIDCADFADRENTAFSVRCLDASIAGYDYQLPGAR